MPNNNSSRYSRPAGDSSFSAFSSNGCRRGGGMFSRYASGASAAGPFPSFDVESPIQSGRRLGPR